MNRYEGEFDDDPTLGNHGWLKGHKWGHEAWNFKPYQGKVYGYVPARSNKINLNKLGADAKDESLDGVTIVFIAREPRSKETRIVGWHRNATVYRVAGGLTLRRGPEVEVNYQIVANELNATLLPPVQRTFRIPTAKVPGNLGQSPLWYGGTDEFREAVRRYIDSWGSTSKQKKRTRTGSARQSDPEKRKMIEVAAVRHACAFYESVRGGSWEVQSVERDGVGWDLTVTRDKEMLKVEVKGLSGSDLCIELTPNEYAKMQSLEHRKDYVLYVVTEAATKNAKSHIFYYNALLSYGRKHIWATEDGRQLKIKELTGARLTL
jgi:hypothetical protein